jgi:anti-sigma B factor antagonist
MLKVHTRTLGNVAVFCLQGRMVNGETALLREAVDTQSSVSMLFLDLSGVSTIDASGLGLMLDLRRLTQSRGIRFKLMNVTKAVSRVLEVTRLDSVFEIAPAVEPLPAISRARSIGPMPWARCA